MTLLLTILAAIISTVLCLKIHNSNLYLYILCLIYWGASLMWSVDLFFALYEDGATAYFSEQIATAGSESLLGVLVIALGLIIWSMIVAVKNFKAKRIKRG